MFVTLGPKMWAPDDTIAASDSELSISHAIKPRMGRTKTARDQSASALRHAKGETIETVAQMFRIRGTSLPRPVSRSRL